MNFEKFNALISPLRVDVLYPRRRKLLKAEQRMIAARVLHPAAKSVPRGTPGKEIEMRCTGTIRGAESP
jgi:hypothetical protein